MRVLRWLAEFIGAIFEPGLAHDEARLRHSRTKRGL